MNNKYFLLLISFGFLIVGIQHKIEAATTEEIALSEASYRGDVPAARLALNNGANINARGVRDRTALLLACMSNRRAVISFLLDNRADINLANSEHETPLMIACDNGDPITIELLLSNGADPSLENYTGRTALNYACKRESLDAIVLLLEYGANIPPNLDEPSMALIQEALKKIAEKKAKTPCKTAPNKIIPRTYEYTSIPYFPPMPKRNK